MNKCVEQKNLKMRSNAKDEKFELKMMNDYSRISAGEQVLITCYYRSSDNSVVTK
jgi:hypothetical protein